jgi:hypothetical protein
VNAASTSAALEPTLPTNFVPVPISPATSQPVTPNVPVMPTPVTTPTAPAPASSPLLPPGLENLLPPGSGVDPTKAERVPLPSLPPEVKPETPTPASTEFDPSQVKVRDRVKTIRKKGQIVELREFTEDEKASRRLFRNAAMMIVCLLILVIVFIVMVKLQ